MKLLGPAPDPSDRHAVRSGAPPTPRRSTACRARLRRRSCAAAIVPPPGRIDRHGPVLASIRRRTTRSARSIAHGRTARRPIAGPTRAVRYVISGCPTPAQDELVKTLALPAERTVGCRAARCTKPRVGLVPAVDRQHGRRLDALGARTVRLRARAPASGGFQVAARRRRSTW